MAPGAASGNNNLDTAPDAVKAQAFWDPNQSDGNIRSREEKKDPRSLVVAALAGTNVTLVANCPPGYNFRPYMPRDSSGIPFQSGAELPGKKNVYIIEARTEPVPGRPGAFTTTIPVPLDLQQKRLAQFFCESNRGQVSLSAGVVPVPNPDLPVATTVPTPTTTSVNGAPVNPNPLSEGKKTEGKKSGEGRLVGGPGKKRPFIGPEAGISGELLLNGSMSPTWAIRERVGLRISSLGAGFDFGFGGWHRHHADNVPAHGSIDGRQRDLDFEREAFGGYADVSWLKRWTRAALGPFLRLYGGYSQAAKRETPDGTISEENGFTGGAEAGARFSYYLINGKKVQLSLGLELAALGIWNNTKVKTPSGPQKTDEFAGGVGGGVLFNADF